MRSRRRGVRCGSPCGIWSRRAIRSTRRSSPLRSGSTGTPGWEHTLNTLGETITGGCGLGSVGWHLAQIRQASVAAALRRFATRAMQAADSPDLPDALRTVRGDLEAINLVDTDLPPTVTDLIMGHLERLETADTTQVIPTGLRDLDRILDGGFRPGQLVIVGATTGAGKSLLLGGFARQAALQQRLPVLWNSLEMDRVEVLDRIIAAEAKVDLSHITRRLTDEHEWARIARSLDGMLAGVLHIDDRSHRTLGDIETVARQVKPALIVVDYLQLMTTSGAGSRSRQEDVAAFSRGLKLIARDLACTVAAAAQLNRAGEGRTDKKPRLSDLRESGAIGNDADIVMLLHRDPVDATAGTDASLLVAKHRNGPLGDIPLVFRGHFARFDDGLTEGWAA